MIGNYSELQTAVAHWLTRPDLVAEIPTCIVLAESEFNRTLRHPQMESRATATMTEYIALPTDFLELRRLGLQGSPARDLEPFPPPNGREYSAQTGKPRFYTMVANQWQFIPAPDSSTYVVEIDYYQKIPALTGAAPTNWLLTSHPDVYLFGALLYGLPYLDSKQWGADTGKIQAIMSGYQNAVESLQAYGARQRYGGARLSIRPKLAP